VVVRKCAEADKHVTRSGAEKVRRRSRGVVERNAVMMDKMPERFEVALPIRTRETKRQRKY
jgi:hypothetical protein